MKSIAVLLLVASFVATVPATPVGDKGTTFPVDWPTIHNKAIQYDKLIKGTFDLLRYLASLNNGPSEVLMTEAVINANENCKNVVRNVLDEIENRSLDCNAVRRYTSEIVNIFLKIFNHLLESADLPQTIHDRVQAIFTATVLDSEKIVDQISNLLGCPVAKVVKTAPINWPTIHLKAVEYDRLIHGTFDLMRFLTSHNAGSSGIFLSERVLQSQMRAGRVLFEVLHEITNQSLDCDDVRHYTGEVLDIFLNIFNTLLESLDLPQEVINHFRAIYVQTVLDSSKITNQIGNLLGCPVPLY